MDSGNYIIVNGRFVRKSSSKRIPKVIHGFICKHLNRTVPVSSDAIFVPGSGFVCDCGHWTEEDPEFHSYVSNFLEDIE